MEQEVQTQLATKTSVGTQLAVGVMIAAGFVASFGIVAGFAYKIPNLSQKKPVSVTTQSQPRPLELSSVKEAWVTLSSHGDTIEFSIFAGAQPLGSGNQGGWTPTQTAVRPVSVRIDLTSPREASVITLESKGMYHTICVPEDDRRIAESSYYVDRQGNVYTDPSLTNRENPHSCSDITQRSMRPSRIGNIFINEPYGANAGALVMTYRRDRTVLADYDPGVGEYTSGSPVEQNTKSPLVLDFVAPSAGGVYLTLGRSLTLITQYEGSAELHRDTLCLGPEGIGGLGSRFFFDRQGTAYRDVFLTERATEMTCPHHLAESLVPENITSISINEPLLEGVVPVNMVVYRDMTQMAFLDASSNVAVAGDTVTESRAPLALRYSHEAETSQDLPQRLLTVETTSRESTQTAILCIPRTILPVGYTQVYFYSQDGTPYHDGLLQQPVMDDSCSELLASTFRPTGIFHAVGDLASVTSPLDAVFSRSGTSLGVLHFETNVYEAGGEAGEGAEPLAVTLTPTTPPGGVIISPESIEIKYRQGSNNSEESLTLCIGPESIGSTPVRYYFDTNGTPYYDVFLEQEAECSE